MCCAEPGTQYHRPAACSLLHHTTHTEGQWCMALGQGGLQIIFIERETTITMHEEPGPGQGVTGDNAMETFALILAPHPRHHSITIPHINPDQNF